MPMAAPLVHIPDGSPCENPVLLQAVFMVVQSMFVSFVCCYGIVGGGINRCAVQGCHVIQDHAYRYAFQ